MRALIREARWFVGDFLAYGGRRVAVAAALVALGALVEGVGVLMLVPLLAIITGAQDAAGLVGQMTRWMLDQIPFESRVGQLAAPLVVFAVLMVLRSVIILKRDLTLGGLTIGYVETLRLKLTRRLAGADWGTISQISHARIAHLMMTEIPRCGMAATFAVQAGVAVVMLVVQISLAFLLSPPLALLTLAMLAIAALALAPLLNRARVAGASIATNRMGLVRDMGLFLGGLKQAFSHNREDAFVDQVQDILDRLHDTQINFTRQQTVARLALAGMSAMIGGVALLVGYGVLGLGPSILMALLFVLARLGGPAGQLQQGAVQLANALPAFEQVNALEKELAAAGRPAQISSGPALARGAPVAFASVGYLHRTAEGVHGVTDLDLVIQPGSFVGVGGPSGAGKTTFADLLAGLYPPQSGAISVGGRVLDAASARTWRDQVAYVSQDPFLFHDTVRRNLLWSAPEASESDLWDALVLAGGEAVVRGLPDGLDTTVGERGGLVSGGERQRLALARAVLRQPDLLILDEATSAIDVQSEADILGRLRAAYPRMTVVIVAHRAESLAPCDRLLMLEGGRLVADRPA